MANTRDYSSPGIFAETATVVSNDTGTRTSGQAYRQTPLAPADVETGFRADTTENVDKILNQILFEYGSIITALDKQGILGWSDAVNYDVPAVVWGSDSNMYVALLPSGPDNGGTQDPIAGGLFWEEFKSDASLYTEFKLDVDAVDASLIPLVAITVGYYTFTLSYDASISAIILANPNPIASGIDYRGTYSSKLSSDPNEQNLEVNQTSNNGVTSYLNAVAGTFSFLSNGFFPGSEGDKQYFDLLVDASLRNDGFIFKNMSIFRDWGGVSIEGKFREILR